MTSLIVTVVISCIFHVVTFWVAEPLVGGWKASTVASTIHTVGALTGSALTLARADWTDAASMIRDDVVLIRVKKNSDDGQSSGDGQSETSLHGVTPPLHGVPLVREKGNEKGTNYVGYEEQDGRPASAAKRAEGDHEEESQVVHLAADNEVANPEYAELRASHVVAASVGYFIADSLAMLFFFRDPRNAASLLHHVFLLAMLAPSCAFGVGVNVIASLLIEEASTLPLNAKEFIAPGTTLNLFCQAAFVVLFFLSRFVVSLYLMLKPNWIPAIAALPTATALLVGFQLLLYAATRVLNCYWGVKIVNKVAKMFCRAAQSPKEQ